MLKVMLFVEDLAHELFLIPLVERIAGDRSVVVNVESRSVRGGRGRMLSELGQFLKDLESGKAVGMPDLFVVGTDANCKGQLERQKEIEKRIPEKFREFTAYAIPDPHIERWMLVDSHAFKQQFGQGCNAPGTKCDRDRYKDQLFSQICASGVTPQLGGMEHAESIVSCLDIEHCIRNDASFKQFVVRLRRLLA
ncbi:MAG: hypothetical protein HYV27_09085 [Candidatus Hydrogenedentes bacterium]|nr:hypothetical protein [Candidatus Hydrogenedentota bacterium]